MNLKEHKLKTDTVVIGAGVIGLSIAREVAKKGDKVIVLEKNPRAGEETSSRNSGVIHSGIYYPTGSNKAIFCLEGNKLLYEYAKARNITHKNSGKIVVATSIDEVKKLHQLYQNGLNNDVRGLKLLNKKDVESLQSEIIVEEGLYSESSGIIDVAEFVQSLEVELQQLDVVLAYNSPVDEIEINGHQGFYTNSIGVESFSIQSEKVINAAGLQAVNIAKKIKGICPDIIPDSYYAKGHYFQLSGDHPFKNELIYPLNEKDGLGIHVTVDITGKAKFGPDVKWIKEIDYSFDVSLKEKFVEVIKSYWPNLKSEKLLPDYTGIRPKIYGPNEEPADFLIQTVKDHKIEGLVNLLGIESPGLTSSLAIAKEVTKDLF